MVPAPQKLTADYLASVRQLETRLRAEVVVRDANAASTFRRLSGAEVGRLREKLIDIATVRSGDTPERLARNMNFDDYRVERFRVLNTRKS